MDLIILGQGYVGLPLAVNAAKSGIKVYGFDIDINKINRLKLGISESPEVKNSDLMKLQEDKKIEFINQLPKLKESAIFVIAVPTPLLKNRQPDLSMLEKACQLISSVVVDGSLIINESTSFIGTLSQFVKPKIDLGSGLMNIDYAVAPERIDPGNKEWNMQSTPRIVSGIDEKSTRRVFEFYSKFCSQVNIVSKPEVAEAAKLFENTFRLVNIALVNELSELSFRFNFSTQEAITAASTKPYGFLAFYPSIGVGGHCIPVDPNYLSYSAEQVGANLDLIHLADKINLEIHQKIVSRIEGLLGGKLQGKQIQVAGIAYKPNVSDLRESPALTLIMYLKKLGAFVTWHDPLVKHWNNENSTLLKSELDLALIVTPHDLIDFSIWKNANVKVLDLSANSNDYGWPKFL